jgi:hypothetical protein
MTKLVREFSAAGPCLTLGRFVKRTSKFIMYNQWQGGDSFSPTVSRVGGYKVQVREDGREGLVHTSPCRSCRDHSETMYPHGYMD